MSTISIDRELLREIQHKLESVCDHAWDRYASRYYGYGDLTYEQKLRKGDEDAYDLMKTIETILDENSEEKEDTDVTTGY